ncbi:MAG TPA: DUF1329 domain-containing protein [Candidatus Binataceae bacterium]|nr:DUF1329 domain-containing protein [Candidatus Binataceae bacterium]
MVERLNRNFWRHGSRALMLALVSGVVASLMASATQAQDFRTYTRNTYETWLHKYADAKPDFKPGDVLTAKDLEKIRPFMPPGYLEQLNFPDFKMAIIAPVNHMPRRDYMDCTEKYQGQVKLRSDGALANYVCGQAFVSTTMDTTDPDSGIKAAWNFEYRWQNYGLAALNVIWSWENFGGSHTAPVPNNPPPQWMPFTDFSEKLPTDTTELYGGGGTFNRSLQSSYQRVYFSHLAQLEDKGGALPMPGAKDFEFKDFIGFFEPFDIRGSAFIIYRYVEPTRSDDAWGYIPNLRHVRRISIESKSDSVLGTDYTLEDFGGFSGRPLEWTWKFLGWKDVLGVLDSKWEYAHLYGPNGIIPDDAWSVRRYAIVERKPKLPNHPYSSVLIFWDAENWYPSFSIAFDRSGKLWKIALWQQRWSEDYTTDWSAINKGIQAGTFQSAQILDLGKSRGTILMGYGVGYPNVTARHAAELYDINNLEQAHR